MSDVGPRTLPKARQHLGDAQCKGCAQAGGNDSAARVARGPIPSRQKESGQQRDEEILPVEGDELEHVLKPVALDREAVEAVVDREVHARSVGRTSGRLYPFHAKRLRQSRLADDRRPIGGGHGVASGPGERPVELAKRRDFEPTAAPDRPGVDAVGFGLPIPTQVRGGRRESQAAQLHPAPAGGGGDWAAARSTAHINDKTEIDDHRPSGRIAPSSREPA